MNPPIPACPLLDPKRFPNLSESGRRCQYPGLRIYMENQREPCHQDGQCVAAKKYPEAARVEASVIGIVAIIKKKPSKKPVHV